MSVFYPVVSAVNFLDLLLTSDPSFALKDSHENGIFHKYANFGLTKISLDREIISLQIFVMCIQCVIPQFPVRILTSCYQMRFKTFNWSFIYFRHITLYHFSSWRDYGKLMGMIEGFLIVTFSKCNNP